jgi:hypothetical protein
MKKQTRLLAWGLLAAYAVTMRPLQAETGIEGKTSWQRWKKPAIAGGLVIGGIAAWCLLDFWMNRQFNEKLGDTIKGLVDGTKLNSFFEDDGTLRKHPYISDKDYQLYENARFGEMVTPLSDAVGSIKSEVLSTMRRGGTINLSYLSYCVSSFNVHLLAYQIGSKLCFLTALLGGYWLMQPEQASSDTKTVQS